MSVSKTITTISLAGLLAAGGTTAAFANETPAPTAETATAAPKPVATTTAEDNATGQEQTLRTGFLPSTSKTVLEPLVSAQNSK